MNTTNRIAELNPIYRGIWSQVCTDRGHLATSFFYADPDRVETGGQKVNFPALFRLLRTKDKVGTTCYRTFVTRSEEFLFCLQVNEYPDANEEKNENHLLELVTAFFKALNESNKVNCTMPTEIIWFRRNLQQFCLCIKVDCEVNINKEDILC